MKKLLAVLILTASTSMLHADYYGNGGCSSCPGGQCQAPYYPAGPAQGPYQPQPGQYMPQGGYAPQGQYPQGQYMPQGQYYQGQQSMPQGQPMSNQPRTSNY